MPDFARLLIVLSALLFLGGCKASASLTMTASPGHASASGEVHVPARQIHIVRNGDRLVYSGGEIEFETASSALTAESTVVIDRYAAVLKQYPTLKLRVEGHTDTRGSASSNQQLSEQRALAIKAALVRRGVAGERLDTRGFGETRPERVEPSACRNRSEDTVAETKLAECQEIWTANRRAGFIVTEGADSLPNEGTELAEGSSEPVEKDRSARRPRPDWALRMFGGYSLASPGFILHGGHLGVGLHASQRFGARGRGYIGGGPRLHYRGLRYREASTVLGVDHDLGVHQFGPEGDLLVGGGSSRVVGLFSLRLGLGLSATRGHAIDDMGATDLREVALTGWLLGGVVVLAKLTPRWSLGGHVEAGLTRVRDRAGIASELRDPHALVTEIGLNVAWHFGRGRRDGI